MSNSLEVLIAKQLVSQIETDRDDGTFIERDFAADWEFSNRVELRHDGLSNIPEEWKLPDSRLHVRVMIPQVPNFIRKLNRKQLAYFTHLDIDVRMRLGQESQDSDQTIDRNRLSQLCRFVEQIFLRTGPDLTTERLTITGMADSDLSGNCMWLEGATDQIGVGGEEGKGSRIMFKYHADALRESHFYGAVRQVFKVT